MAHSQMEEHIIFRWLSLKSTLDYIGEWDALYNPDFNYTEFGTIRNQAGSNNFVLSVKQWIERTGAIGITAKTGRYGGTYAHKDIAFHFGNDGAAQKDRLLKLNKIAIHQMTVLSGIESRKLLR
jgi:hypothetical protein